MNRELSFSFFLIFQILLSDGRILETNEISFDIASCKNDTDVDDQVIKIPESLIYRAFKEPANESVLLRTNASIICSSCADSQLGELNLTGNTNDIIFTKEGFFGKKSMANKITITTWFKPEEICGEIISSAEGSLEALAIWFCGECQNSMNHIGNDPVKLTKCCPPGYIQDGRTHENFTCQPAGLKQWKPTFYNPESFNTGLCVTKSEIEVKYRIITIENIFDGRGAKFIRDPYAYFKYNTTQPRKRWRLMSNGSVVLRMERSKRLDLYAKWKQPSFIGNTFCVDGIVNFNIDPFYDNGKMSEILKFPWRDEYSLRRNTTVPVYTKPGVKERKGITKAIVFVVAYYLSLVPLTLMLLAYLLTWEKQNIHGWTILSHVVCLIAGNLFAGTGALLDAILFTEQRRGMFCIIVGVGAHFFYLAGFMWLTMINFDIWCTFRNMKSIRSKVNGLSRYLSYLLVSFGIPLIISGVSLGLDLTYGDYALNDSDCEIIIPRYGIDRCFVSVHGEGVYIYYPIAILVVLNAIFFLLSSRKIWANRLQNTGTFQGKLAIKDQRVLIFLKLFLVMGVTFSFDLIAWVSEPSVSTLDDISLVFFLIYVFNICVRAIALFFIFAWKKQIRETVQLRLTRLGTFTHTVREDQTHSTDQSGANPGVDE